MFNFNSPIHHPLSFWSRPEIRTPAATPLASAARAQAAPTPNLPTKNLPTEIARLKLLGKFPMDMRIPPLD